jgi:hypothetical protein
MKKPGQFTEIGGRSPLRLWQRDPAAALDGTPVMGDINPQN